MSSEARSSSESPATSARWAARSATSKRTRRPCSGSTVRWPVWRAGWWGREAFGRVDGASGEYPQPGYRLGRVVRFGWRRRCRGSRRRVGSGLLRRPRSGGRHGAGLVAELRAPEGGSRSCDAGGSRCPGCGSAHVPPPAVAVASGRGIVIERSSSGTVRRAPVRSGTGSVRPQERRGGCWFLPIGWEYAMDDGDRPSSAEQVTALIGTAALL